MNTEVILGSGGTGKSTLLRERIESDPKYALLTASTGIAAVNLGEGVTTVHSALGFFDTRSLIELQSRNGVKRKALELAQRGKKNLVLDEISMVSAEQFQTIHTGFELAAMEREARGLESCGIIAVGDFCQLSPVPERDSKEPAKYAFEAPCWPLYEANMTRLTKVYRQDNQAFLEALSLIRAGRGVDGAIALKQCGVQFSPTQDKQYDGITLFPVNSQVESYNEKRLAELPGSTVEIKSERWGVCRGEWKNIPDVLRLKDGALVMVLANELGTFRYVNGDLGTFSTGYISQFTELYPIQARGYDFRNVETKRGYKGPIPMVIRRNISYDPKLVAQFKVVFDVDEQGKRLNSIEDNEGRSKYWTSVYIDYVESHSMQGQCYYDPKNDGVVVGEIEYMPLRLAYGSSYHKVQGLTLDKCQICIDHFWAGQPAMIYVALTRCRTPEGLRIVGDVKQLAKRVKTDQRVMRWV